jgi:hypothetical protein
MQRIQNRFWIFVGVFFLLNCVYSVWSFTQTDPNLVFTTWPPFWSFQNWSWQLSNLTTTHIYIFLLSALFGVYWFVAQNIPSNFSLKKVLLIGAFIASPLLFSNNALSHDVFNYIFNAKMAVKYGADPHVKVALDFKFDPWTRFMHNVHTPAPYFYGWTALSTIPYFLGFEKFVLTWLLFRLWSALGLGLSLFFLWKIMEKSGMGTLRHFAFVMFNPLLLIELISNSHNDGWMMWPALAALWLVMEKNKSFPSLVKIGLSLALLLFSFSTKYATVVLIPIWLSLIFSHKLKWKFIEDFRFDVASLLLFVPLLTARSQYFHPWYLSWSFLFFPLVKSRWIKVALIVLSISSMFRYTPWIHYGGFEFTPLIEYQQRLITWAPLVLVPLFYIVSILASKLSKSRLK